MENQENQGSQGSQGSWNRRAAALIVAVALIGILSGCKPKAEFAPLPAQARNAASADSAKAESAAPQAAGAQGAAPAAGVQVESGRSQASQAWAAAHQNGNRGKKFGDPMECLLDPYMVANVGSPVEGTLGQVLVDRGAVVRKGQVIARLNAPVEAATVTLKAAQEEFGQRKLARNEELYRKELISAHEKDELETQMRVAALERKQQQAVLNLRTITSPLNGVVVERYLSPGDHIAQEKIFKLAQIDPLNVEVIVPVELFGMIRQGMKGEVRLDPMMSGTYTATVKVVDRVIDAASGTFGVRLELRNPGNRIPSGIRCNVRFLKDGENAGQ